MGLVDAVTERTGSVKALEMSAGCCEISASGGNDAHFVAVSRGAPIAKIDID
jgi:hypothetical protein